MLKPLPLISSSISLFDIRRDILNKAIEFAGLPVASAWFSVREISGPADGVWTISSHAGVLEVKVLLGNDEVIDGIAEGVTRTQEVLARRRRRLRKNTLETDIMKFECFDCDVILSLREPAMLTCLEGGWLMDIGRKSSTPLRGAKTVIDNEGNSLAANSLSPLVCKHGATSNAYSGAFFVALFLRTKRLDIVARHEQKLVPRPSIRWEFIICYYCPNYTLARNCRIGPSFLLANTSWIWYSVSLFLPSSSSLLPAPSLVPGASLRSYKYKTLAIVTVNSTYARPLPMHPRGPMLKGLNADWAAWRLL